MMLDSSSLSATASIKAKSGSDDQPGLFMNNPGWLFTHQVAS